MTARTVTPKPSDANSRFSEQINALRYDFLLEQIPLLYAVMLTASMIAALVFQSSAPTALVTAVPFALACVTMVRAVKWLRMKRKKLSARQIETQLLLTTFLAPIMAFVFTVWAAALFDYGNEYQKALIVLLVLVCAILTAVILSIQPKASNFAVAAACIPFAIKFVSAGEFLLTCMFLVFVLVALLILQVLKRYSVSFTRLIESKIAQDKQNSEIVKAKRALTRLAYRDELSNLPNRRKFDRKLQTLIDNDTAGVAQIYIGIIDLDGFNAINDVYGYAVGDSVLWQVARRLELAIQGQGIVARYDGDEFAFILTSKINRYDAAHFAAKLCGDIETPYEFDNQSAILTASCGISRYPANGVTAETLTNRAYYALHHAKCHAGTKIGTFDQEHENEIQLRSKIKQALRHAIAQDDFLVVFQPIVDLKTRKIVTCEALARWVDADLGNVSPDLFIPIAEQSGVISDLTYLLLKNAAEAATHWPDDVLLSFNMSAQEIVKPTAGLKILSILNDVGLDTRRLEVEITETALLDNFDAANATLRSLRSAGVKVALDDFGTGQSSLQYVEKIDLDKLKIDKAFVDTVESSDKTRHIVRAIADMCNNLNVKTVAEGIEVEAQASIMRDLGCTYGQGYLFDRPLRQAELMGRFNDWDSLIQRTPGPLAASK